MTIEDLKNAEFDMRKVHAYIEESNCVALLWPISCVKEVRPDLNDEQCMVVLRNFVDRYVFDDGPGQCADTMFPPPNDEPPRSP